jgi:cytochrome b
MPRPPQSKVSPPDLWDPVVRITHWGLAGIILMNAVLNEGGSLLHVWLGWIGMALLILRLGWGGFGPKEARFSAFPPNPRAAISHLRGLLAGRARHYPSHNPAGALVIYAFWALLLVVTVTGLMMTGGQTPMQVARDKAAVASGDWSVLVTEEDEGGESRFGDLAEEAHEVAANLILLLAVLHIAGVVIESRAMGRNLVAAMIAGRRRGR